MIKEYKIGEVVALGHETSGDQHFVQVQTLAGISPYACSSGYPFRRVGDQVIVVQIDSGGWFVLCRMPDDGSRSLAPYRMWSTVRSCTWNGTAAVLETITFPADLFTVAPLVLLTKQGSTAGRTVPFVSSVSASSALIGIFDPTGGLAASVDVGVLAMQASPGSATGLNGF